MRHFPFTSACITFLLGAFARDSAALDCAREVQSGFIYSRHYQKLNIPNENGVYLYVPDISTQINGGAVELRAFDLHVIEGVYANPFPKDAAGINPNNMNSLETFGNIKLEKVRLTEQNRANQEHIVVGRNGRYIVKIVNVRKPILAFGGLWYTVCSVDELPN